MFNIANVRLLPSQVQPFICTTLPWKKSLAVVGSAASEDTQDPTFADVCPWPAGEADRCVEYLLPVCCRRPVAQGRPCSDCILLTLRCDRQHRPKSGSTRYTVSEG